MVGSSCGSAPSERRTSKLLADNAPVGPILGARVPHIGAKEALILSEPDVYLTTPHFDGYPLLVRLDHIGSTGLEELITEAWLDRAPRKTTRQWVDDHQG